MKRTTLMAAVTAAMLAGAAQAAVTELTIYKQPNFRGDSQTIKGTVNVLEGGFDNETSSIVAKGGYWEVCSGDRFSGNCRVLEPGEYPSLSRVLADRITSARFLGASPKLAGRDVYHPDGRRDRGDRDGRDNRRDRSHASVDLYGQPGFRGRSVRIESDTDSLADARFDGRASSLVVNEGVWQLCSEPGYQGICGTYPPGRYSQLAGLDDRVSSMRRVR